jgi:lysyl-tRNA synthetase class 2
VNWIGRGRHDRTHSGVAVWVGRAVTLAALWALISTPFRDGRAVLLANDVIGTLGIPVSSSVVNAAILGLIGGALRRRLRIGWITAVIFEATNVVALGAATWYLFFTRDASGHRVVTAFDVTDRVWIAAGFLVGSAVLVLLVLGRRSFPARLRRGSWAATLGVAAAGFVAVFAFTFALTEAFPHQLHQGRERIAWSLRATLGFDYGSRPNINGHSGTGWVAGLSGLLSGVALLGAAATFLRSARSQELLSAADELHLRRLLAEHGERDSLGYFATRRDKSVVFSPDGRAAVTFRTIATVSLASGDPIGAQSSWPAAVEAWLNHSHAHGWYPAAIGASEDGARVFAAAELRAVRLGDEAILDIEDFRLTDPDLRPVRQAVQRVTRAGYRIEVRRHSELSAEELAHLADLAEQWRGDEPDRGFSMALNRLGDPVDGRCVMVTAHDETGAVRGMQSYVPWGTRGLSLDLMRRDRQAPTGTTEFLVAGLVGAAGGLGVRRVSLNFAVFRSVFHRAEDVGAGPLLKVSEGALSFASRFWQIESLYRSNDKYRPTWSPRYFCIDSALTAPRSMIAGGMAEGFLPAPQPTPRSTTDETVEVNGRQVPFVTAVLEQDDRLLHAARPTRRLTTQQQHRRRKLDLLRAAGMDPYPVEVPRNRTLAEAAAIGAGLAPGASSGTTVSVAARVRAVRDFGGLCFALLSAGPDRLQVMTRRDGVGAAAHDLWRHAVDVGDLVSVTGEVVASRHGEITVDATSWTMAAKCLRPLPGLHAGFSDADARVRQRHLDMIVNTETLALLEARTRAVAALRRGFVARGFAEVETPILQTVHGGAAARPFHTHINAYDMGLSLRIAPELYLKRLAVGGMQRIFEVGRNFRNEGVDATHNPEFTAAEAYEAFGDYTSMRLLTRELIIDMATAVHGEPVAVRPTADGGTERLRIDGDWPVIPVHAAVGRAVGETVDTSTSVEHLRQLCRHHGVAFRPEHSAGELVVELYDELVEGSTTLPTFYTDFPIETSPLTRVHRVDPKLSERWDLVAFGAELGTAYSELIDPVEQRARLTEQSFKAAAGDIEAMELDEDFLGALEFAMPPTGGLGLGVDRIVMLLCGVNIRATLAFPFVRPTER